MENYIFYVLNSWPEIQFRFKLQGYPLVSLIFSQYGDSWFLEFKHGENKPPSAAKYMDRIEKKGFERSLRLGKQGIEEGF